MINPIYYYDIYILFVTILTWIFVNRYNSIHVLQNGIVKTETLGVIIASVIILFVGFRPEHVVFQDTLAYIAHYRAVEGDVFSSVMDEENPLFYSILYYVASLRLGYNVFFLIVATIYYGAILFSCIWMFKKHGLLAFVTYLGAFSTYSYSVNGIKAGAAASIFLVGLAFMANNRKWLAWLFVLLSYGFHHSMVMCIAAFAIVYFYNKNSRLYFYGWILCFLIAAAHITAFQEWFGSLMSDREDSGSTYLLNGGMVIGSRAGFRFDFVLYSAAPVLVGYIAKFKKNIQSKTYDFLLHLYLLTNAIWMLCMYANFTNRIAYLSWLMYPIVLLYPVLGPDCNWGNNRKKVLKTFIIYHLLFTLAMHYIYDILFR